MIVEPVTQAPKIDTNTGDHDRLTHIVPKDKLADALIFGTPVKALCGKIWVPSRDPQKFAVCQTCKNILDKRGGVCNG